MAPIRGSVAGRRALAPVKALNSPLITSPASKGDFAATLPGEAMDSVSKKQLELEKARKTLKEQQQRLSRFDLLIKKVKTECDNQEAVKKIKGFPTPQKKGRSDAIERIESDNKKTSTPIQRLLNGENKLKRTPLSVPKTHAWAGNNMQDTPTTNSNYLRIGDSNTPMQSSIVASSDMRGENEFRHFESEYISINRVEVFEKEEEENSNADSDNEYVQIEDVVLSDDYFSRPASAQTTPDIVEEPVYAYARASEEPTYARASKEPQTEALHLKEGSPPPSCRKTPPVMDSNDDDEDDDEYLEIVRTAKKQGQKLRKAPSTSRPVGLLNFEHESLNSMSAPPLHTAAARGTVKELQKLVKKQKSDINQGDKQGRTALMYAMRFQQMGAVSWLLSNGADINKQTNDKSTVLHYTAFEGTGEAVRYLLNRRANFRLKDNEGRTPLHWAMHNFRAKVLNELLAEPSLTLDDLNARDNTMMTPAMWACFYSRGRHLAQLIHCGADMNIVDKYGIAPVHWSVVVGGCSCLKILLNYKSSFLMDGKGRSVIHHAAENGNREAIRICTNMRPACVHDVDNNGRTPLHWAAACNQIGAIKALIKKGSYVSRLDSTGNTALEYVEAHGFEKASEILADATVWQKKPRMGPASGSTSIRSFHIAVPEGGLQPSEEARELFRTLSIGMYLHKFAHAGNGKFHKRYFWLDSFTGELCWAKSPKHFYKNPELASSVFLTDVAEGARPIITERPDYSPDAAHRYAFTLKSKSRTIDLVAASKTEYLIWTEGLRCLKVFGEHLLEVDARNEE